MKLSIEEFYQKELEKFYQIRKKLHSNAELSGKEKETAKILEQILLESNPDKIVTKVGGYGLYALFKGKARGPKIVLRCDIDALPIDESLEIDYASKKQGVSHKCGHDGHMTIMIGVAKYLSQNRPEYGEVILLFQPSEEDGKGALKVIDDPKFKEIKPDYIFGLHNIPGFPFGSIILKKGIFASASKGVICNLKGASSHASEPEKGRSPALALSYIIQGLNSIPQASTSFNESAQITVIYAKLGEIAFGTSPSLAQIMATLRSHSNKTMEILTDKSSKLINKTASTWDLNYSINWTDDFVATINNEEAIDTIIKAAKQQNLQIQKIEHPVPWSEDFGFFTQHYKGALFGLGSGINFPSLHDSNYDFPDELIKEGGKIFIEIVNQLCKI